MLVAAAVGLRRRRRRQQHLDQGLRRIRGVEIGHPAPPVAQLIHGDHGERAAEASHVSHLLHRLELDGDSGLEASLTGARARVFGPRDDLNLARDVWRDADFRRRVGRGAGTTGCRRAKLNDGNNEAAKVEKV